MPALSRLSAVFASAALVVGLAACSDSSDGHAEQKTELRAAMDSVSGKGPASAYFEYGDLARFRQLHVLNGDPLHDKSQPLVNPRWATVTGVGTGTLGDFALKLPDPTGINIYGMDTAVTIGSPPDTAVSFTGSVNADEITNKLKGLGAKPKSFGGTDGLTTAEDNKVDMNSPITKKTGLINQLNQLVVTDHRLTASPKSASLQAALGTDGASLLKTGNYADVADCLGDVVAAVILTPKRQGNSTVVAVGVRNAASATATAHEVLCVLPADGKQSAVRAAVKQRLAPSATDPVSRTPNSEYFSDMQVHNDGDLVQVVLTLTPKTAIGYLIHGMYSGLEGYWDGSCTEIDLAKRTC